MTLSLPTAEPLRADLGWLGGLGADWLADEDDVDAAGQLLVSARPGVDLARMSHAKAS